MSAFNLPPGVSVNDIPGNSPQDVRYEQTYERTLQRLLDGDLALELSEPMARELLEELVCWIVPTWSEEQYAAHIAADRLSRLNRIVSRYARTRASELTEAYLEAADRG